jgi:hypothetical protein
MASYHHFKTGLVWIAFRFLIKARFMNILKEGSIVFGLNHPHSDWTTNKNSYNFGTIEKSGITIKAIKDPDRTFRLKISGPFGQQFSLSEPIPKCDENGLSVAITWKDFELKLYLNGKLTDSVLISEKEKTQTSLKDYEQHGRIVKVKKSLERKLSDLEEHLFLLKHHFDHLMEREAHLKVLSATLRVLICKSSKTEGLLWRMANELNVSDEVHLQIACKLDHNHPLANGLHYSFVPINRAGAGDPRLPSDYYPLKQVIKECEAVIVFGKGLTYQELIADVAQQMGSAHEPDGVDPELVELGALSKDERTELYHIFTVITDLTLDVGYRILQKTKVDFKHIRDDDALKPFS